MDLFVCQMCGEEFLPYRKSQRFCCSRCQLRSRKRNGSGRVVRQYELISGNWRKYLNRLLQNRGRKATLNLDDCLALLERQRYRCALTGTRLTCRLQQGKRTNTNASIDRINPKKGYHLSNIQIVCVAVNRLRVDMSVREFHTWCRKVVDHALCEQTPSVQKRIRAVRRNPDGEEEASREEQGSGDDDEEGPSP